jgi:hypothetical protein
VDTLVTLNVSFEARKHVRLGVFGDEPSEEAVTNVTIEPEEPVTGSVIFQN